MNKATLSQNIKQLGLRLFEDKTALELEDIIKEIFPNAQLLSNFINYKNNIGNIIFKVNEPYHDEFGKTELWTEAKIIEEYLRVYDLYIEIKKHEKNKAILKAYISVDYIDNENELKYFNSNIETIYAVNEGNRILNYYIDAVTAQRQENEDYINYYKNFSTQTIDEVELKSKVKSLGKLLLDTQNLKQPNYSQIKNSIIEIFPSSKYKGCIDVYEIDANVNTIRFSILEEYTGKITHNHVASKSIKDAKAKTEFINIYIKINKELGCASIEAKLCDTYVGNNQVLDINERTISITNLEHTIFENIKSEIESINKSLYLKGKKTAKECEALIMNLLEKDEHKNEYVKDILLKARNRYSRLGDIE
ncbi:hypothetical protein [Intestinibacter bartlettii]|uniref:Uncharacterized protein n=1 Tax=Intestinibacter bartlettii TaxID=261299 RepID=A0ABS6DWE4_9FIRM|nr:hypothetical protein [Intestinibacter bartlettii]MBU5336178.1 hypothetical protein [Intestinibacter bartlettii]